MSQIDLNKLLRANIKQLKPYSSARDEFSGTASVFLDANENPYNEPYNRYPDPLQRELKSRISQIKGVDAAKIFLGNGSDEPIDLLFRAFCEPGKDNIVAMEPSYGMYTVAADINNIKVKPALLNSDYSLNTDTVLNAVDEHTKLIFLCSPNNPTANLLKKEAIEPILDRFKGLVIIDEAYIDFAPEATWLKQLDKYPNLVVLQTFSKAWGMAAIRLGMAFAATEIIQVLNKIKYPYNLNILTQQKAMELLKDDVKKTNWVDAILKERERLKGELLSIPYVEQIYPSDANFLLVKVKDADGIYHKLIDNSVIVRNRSRVKLCQGSLRITVGTPEENIKLITALTALNA
ncbi:histidinol-phosphate transaminase [Saccharicrinis sp. FJH62]|uniref:histidinol-phosphate transaminase n=1 Tax=Saccharicrinis sp. FJH62 TaxID=3344657 RepID=UPI0035D4F401